MRKSISLIIPTYKTDTHLEQCLKHVGQCSPPPQEIILVVDGDTGQVLPQIERDDVKILRLPTPGGPGRARNAGAKEALGDILLFIDADVIVPVDICSKFYKAFSTDPKPDAVFGSYDDEPPEQSIVSQYKNLLHHYTHQNSETDAFTFWTGCGAILKSQFIELNGFSEQYTEPSIEDIELGYRLKQAGATILLDRSIQATHLKKWTLSDLVRTDFFLRAIPWSRLIIEHGTMNNDMNINLNSRMSVVVCFLLLFSLFLSIFHIVFAPSAALLFILFVIFNKHIFLFFLKKRGIVFSLKTIPLHLLYYLVSGFAFGSVFLKHRLKNFGAKKRETVSPTELTNRNVMPLNRSSPTISIGMPVYNGENFIAKAIDSILSQSFPDFELIICDNASTDATPQICQEFADRDDRIRYINSSENRGASGNFNRAFHVGRGRYFKWAAHDDELAPHYLKQCIDVLENRNDVILCHTQVNVIDEAGEVIRHDPIDAYPLDSDMASERFNALIRTDLDNYEVFGVIRNEVLEKTPLIPGYIASDRVLRAELGLRGKFHILPEPLFFCRDHPMRSIRAMPAHHKRGQWFDPKLKSRFIFPHWRIFAEYFKCIGRVEELSAISMQPSG